MKKLSTFIGILTLALVGCTTPAVFQVELDGWDLRTDGEFLIALGEGSGTATVRLKGSEVPLLSIPFLTQSGDWLLVDEGESHHLPYSSPMPAKARTLFTDADLEALAERGIVLSFE